MGVNIAQREFKLKIAFNEFLSMIDKFISARWIRILTFQNIKFQVLSGRGLRPDPSTPFQRKPHFSSEQNLAEVKEHYRSVHMAIQKS